MPLAATLVTSNRNKLTEARAVLEPYGIRLKGRLRRLPEPQVDSLEEVVRAKLRAVGPMPEPVLVEDSGLFLEGLKGFPGVYSAYAYRTLGLDGILRVLAGRARGATFRTVVGLRRGSRVRICAGEISGRIAPAPRGRGGFGYDPIFLPGRSLVCFAELPLEGKNALSHRARAFRAAVELLRTPARARPGL
ncbi:MAG: non-canonical purine NTP pyrophosphatase [Thermoplasmata archaeon]